MSCRATSCAYLLSFCLLLLAVPSLSEIHRARSIQTFKHRFRSADTDSKPEISEWTKWFEDKVWGHPRRVWVYSSISAGLVGLTGLFPLFVIPVSCGAGLKSKASRGRLQLLLSFAVGGLLGDVFLHLLPEAWVHVDAKSGNLSGYRNIGGWVLTGLLSFYVIERLFGGKDDEDNEEEEEEEEKEKEEEKEEDKMDDKMKTEEDVDGLSGKEETASTSSDDSCNGDITRGFAWKIRKERSGQSNCIKRIKSKKIKKRGVENLSQVDAEHVAAKPSLTSLLSPPPASLKQNYDSSTQLIPAQDNKDHIKVSGWLNLLANVVDNFTHGLAVAGSYSISSKMGLLTTLAILLHEIPHEIGDFAILLQAGFDRWRAAKVQVLTATGGIIGAMMALSAESAKILGDSTAWILPFTAGGFINIALIAIVPELLKESNARNSMKQLLLMCSGIFVMGLVTALVD